MQNGNATGLGGAPASASATEDLSPRSVAPDPAQPLDPADRMARLRSSLAGVVDRAHLQTQLRAYAEKVPEGADNVLLYVPDEEESLVTVKLRMRPRGVPMPTKVKKSVPGLKSIKVDRLS